MAKIQSDKYSNQLIASVTESAANTLTFEQLPQMTTLMEKKAFLINRIQYIISPLTEFKADSESITFGIAMSNQWTGPQLSETSVVDFNSLYTAVLTAVGFAFFVQPVIKDYSKLPGGGVLVPTRPMYLFAKGSALANPCTITMRMHFTIIDLTPADYWDLVEAVSAIS